MVLARDSAQTDEQGLSGVGAAQRADGRAGTEWCWRGTARRQTAAGGGAARRDQDELFDFQLHSPFLVIISHLRTVVLAIVFTV